MYRLLYTKEAKTAIDRLPIKPKRQIKDAVERRAASPDIGKRLTQELKGLLSYRSGDYRLIYRISQEEILVLAVGHRKDVYRQTSRKLP